MLCKLNNQTIDTVSKSGRDGSPMPGKRKAVNESSRKFSFAVKIIRFQPVHHCKKMPSFNFFHIFFIKPIQKEIILPFSPFLTDSTFPLYFQYNLFKT